MAKNVKFASQVDEQTLKELRAYAKESDKSLSKIITEALDEYLSRVKIREDFKKAMDSVLDENEELLKKLAK